MSDEQTINVGTIASMVEEDVDATEQDLDLIEATFGKETREFFEEQIEKSREYAKQLRESEDD